MLRKIGVLLFMSLFVSAVYAQSEPQTKRFGIVSLREILKQVPLPELAVHCKTNEWGEAYRRINSRIINLSLRMEEQPEGKVEQLLREKYRLEQERNNLENSIRGINESVVRQFIVDEFASGFYAILNKDDSCEIVHLALEVTDITSLVITRLRGRFAEKSTD